ncbi:MAG: FmdB family zinc ribbon protein [Actinomycetota bacterium]
MAIYLFRCPDCSLFEVRQPMSEVRPTYSCPACGSEARRVFTPPALRGVEPAVHRLMDAAEESAERPRVVHSIPKGAPRPSSRRWHPVTGAQPVNAGARAAGPHQPLPRW